MPKRGLDLFRRGSAGLILRSSEKEGGTSVLINLLQESHKGDDCFSGFIDSEHTKAQSALNHLHVASTPWGLGRGIAFKASLLLPNGLPLPHIGIDESEPRKAQKGKKKGNKVH